MSQFADPSFAERLFEAAPTLLLVLVVLIITIWQIGVAIARLREHFEQSKHLKAEDVKRRRRINSIAFLVVTLAGLAGSLALRLSASTSPEWDPGPLSFYFLVGLGTGVPIAVWAHLNAAIESSSVVENTQAVISRKIVVTVGAAVFAFIMGFFFIAITAGGA